MMSLALLPIGLIAVMQTISVANKARENAATALLIRTEQAALQERMVIQRAFGAARGFAAAIPAISDDPQKCSAVFGTFLEQFKRYSFAGFVPTTGEMTCSSATRETDLSQAAGAVGTSENEKPGIEVITRTRTSGTAVVFVNQPVFSETTPIGVIRIAIPQRALDQVAALSKQEALIDIITLNANGEVLTGSEGVKAALARMPAGFDLDDVPRYRSRTFRQDGPTGEERLYTLVPIEGGQLFVLGIWDPQIGVSRQVNSFLPAVFFPMMMWLVSLSVALLAIRRLVMRHIKSISTQMSRFTRDRTLETGVKPPDMPSELLEIQSTFQSMAENILREEAELEDAIHQKSVLLKEVHHRVKNNLQLISSILNMQIRDADHEETKRVLRRMQTRVLGLATIHRDLYQTSNAGLVNVGALVREVVENTIEIRADGENGFTLEEDIEDVMLYPDQAVPMSLLAAEVATNAMKHGGISGPGKPWVKVSFRADDNGLCRLVFSNSLGGRTETESTGIGRKLIKAFAVQLGATVDVAFDDQSYTKTVEFEAAAFQPHQVNY